MTPLAPHVTAFLRERLPEQRGASLHTCDTYAYALKLLFEYVSSRTATAPSALNVEDLSAPVILGFLEHLEKKRGNSPRTRNARLVAIKSFMHFMEYREPALLDQVRQVLAVPAKRTDEALVGYLTMAQMKAILDSLPLHTRDGVRDRAMIHLCFSAGLRVSELVTLPLSAVTLHAGPAVHVVGKGRKERSLPLWKQVAVDLRAWVKVRPDVAATELFLNARGVPLTRAGFEYILRKHVKAALPACPALAGKRVTPHVLRHSCAMMILQATGDLRKVSLWLGHADMQSTQVYLRADPTEKLAAVDALVPPSLRQSHYRASDKLIASLTAR